YVLIFVFFFQAEDGIRDATVTGVQTCALPISSASCCRWCDGSTACWGYGRRSGARSARAAAEWRRDGTPCVRRRRAPHPARPRRSEERRVGKECRSRCAPEE